MLFARLDEPNDAPAHGSAAEQRNVDRSTLIRHGPFSVRTPVYRLSRRAQSAAARGSSVWPAASTMGRGTVTRSGHSSLGRILARMLRCGAVIISASQGRIRGCPALAATRLGEPVTGSES